MCNYFAHLLPIFVKQNDLKMAYFPILLRTRNLLKHNGKTLWNYFLSEEEFSALQIELQFSTRMSIDSRDVCLYFSQFWMRQYSGGTPRKEDVFQSIGGNILYNISLDDFYKIAKIGAENLGINWISKQNTLYFRTLLLQGGLPLNLIAENQGKYKEFLEAVLNQQPETIDDFRFKKSITDLLPISGQNEFIYENCFEIVRAILNDDNSYDELFAQNENLKTIVKDLKKQKTNLPQRTRISKPKNYWLLSITEQWSVINLRLGFAENYTTQSLSAILNITAEQRDYQFYINDDLICVFRKTANGKYRTDWFAQQKQSWEITENLPYVYIISDDEKTELPDFIQVNPNLKIPTLWSKFSDNEWRLIKGNATESQEAAVLFPKNWQSNLPVSDILIEDKDLSFLPFEGEITLECGNNVQTFCSGISTIDWNIKSEKPNWIINANMPIVQRRPTVYVYDEDGFIIPNNEFKVYTRRHNTGEIWQTIVLQMSIPLGCNDLKIVKNEIIAYDTYFNIGNVNVNFSHQSIDFAQINFTNLLDFQFKLYESEFLKIEKESNCIEVTVDTKFNKIPNLIKSSIGLSGKKKLHFNLISPFQGMTITDATGKIIDKNQTLSLANLPGLRILSIKGQETVLKLRNNLQNNVTISQTSTETSKPLISIKDEIVMLYYLADAMNYRNSVCLELSAAGIRKQYEISGFSHTLDVNHQLERKIKLYDSEDELELFAIPVNCNAAEIQMISLTKEDEFYIIPATEISNQFIVTSYKKDGQQLMPRFVNTGDLFLGTDKDDRIENFHKSLSESQFDDEIWQQTLQYFKFCIQLKIPFSTFDQIRAISRSSEVAARAFFFLGINQVDIDDYIQKYIPEFEKDLGFGFHWIKKEDWQNAFSEINAKDEFKYYTEIAEIFSTYILNNGIAELSNFIFGQNITIPPVLHSDILAVRERLSARVMEEIPRHSPFVTGNYGINMDNHPFQIRLLLQAPIAVAESICGMQKDFPIWGGDEKREIIRRNIQYVQFLTPILYRKILLYAISKNQ